MKKISLWFVGTAAFCLAAGIQPLRAVNTVVTWTGNAGDGQYTSGGNWSSGGQPDLTTATTALINSGTAVTYTPGGDLGISNGGILEIRSGSWTQAVSNNYIQLAGSGTILVDGGTFNQGTDSANPFSMGATTGNAFTITSGTANFNQNVNFTSGITYSQSGGTTNVTGQVTTAGTTIVLSGGTFATTSEFDVQAASAITISGGILNTATLVAFNNGPASLTLSAGKIVLGSTSWTNGFYGISSTDYVNFTSGSTGAIQFASGVTLSSVQGMVTSGDFAHSGTIDTTLSDFLITTSGGNVVLSLVAAPEPATWAMLGFGMMALLIKVRRVRAARA